MDPLDYIDSYFKGHLLPEESRQFEKKIESDPVFAQDVAFYVSATGFLKEQAEEEIRTRFKELELVQPVKGKVRKLHTMWYSYASAAVIVGLLFGVFLFQNPSPDTLADRYITQHLYQLSPHMSVGDSINIGRGLYNKGDFPGALQIFEAILSSSPSNEQALEYAGITSLRAGNFQKAIDYFIKLEAFDNFSNPGKFYHALALMKRNEKGDEEQAKVLLQQVVEQGLTENEKAANWLKKL